LRSPGRLGLFYFTEHPLHKDVIFEAHSFDTMKSYLPGFIIFVCSLALSFFICKDYGISWDETIQREIGYMSYNYVFNNDEGLNHYIERDHGAGFEMPLIMIEKRLGLSDSRSIYLMRHLVQNLFFLCSMFIGYIFMLRLFKSQFLACLGLLILIFTPRFFAHSFFNSKDIPFMCMFLLSFAASAWAFARNKPLPYFILGLVLGYTTSIRLLGIILIGFIGLFFLIDIFSVRSDRRAIWRKLFSAVLCLVGFCIAVYAFWPTLWRDPLRSFLEAFRNMSHFRFDGEVLLGGEIIKATELPWTYIPTWFVITTPLLWLVFGGVGIIWLIVSFVKQPLRFLANTRDRNFLLYFLILVAPVVMVVALNSVVYDDWRHLYFIYPSFILLLLFGVDKLLRIPRAGIAVKLLCILQFGFVAFFMVKYHPYQQVYFNELTSKADENLRSKYELDYWGLSNKQAMEYILAHDTSSLIIVNDGPTQRYNWLLLPAEDRKRLRPVKEDETSLDYRIALFRTYEYKMPEEKRVYSIKVLNSTILAVYKIKE
jgi:hypothetical protein